MKIELKASDVKFIIDTLNDINDVSKPVAEIIKKKLESQISEIR